MEDSDNTRRVLTLQEAKSMIRNKKVGELRVGPLELGMKSSFNLRSNKDDFIQQQKIKKIKNLSEAKPLNELELGLCADSRRLMDLGWTASNAVSFGWFTLLEQFVLLIPAAYLSYIYFSGGKLSSQANPLQLMSFTNMKHYGQLSRDYYLFFFCPLFLVLLLLAEFWRVRSQLSMQQQDKSIARMSLIFTKQPRDSLFTDYPVQQIQPLSQLVGYQVLKKMQQIHEQHEQAQRCLDHLEVEQLNKKYDFLKEQFFSENIESEPMFFAVTFSDTVTQQQIREHLRSRRLVIQPSSQCILWACSIFQDQELPEYRILPQLYMPEDVLYHNLFTHFNAVLVLSYAVLVIFELVVAVSSCVPLFFYAGVTTCPPTVATENCLCYLKGFSSITFDDCKDHLTLILVDYGMGYLLGIGISAVTLLLGWAVSATVMEYSICPFRTEQNEDSYLYLSLLFHCSFIFLPFLVHFPWFGLSFFNSQLFTLFDYIFNPTYNFILNSVDPLWMSIFGNMFLAEAVIASLAALCLSLRHFISGKASNLVLEHALHSLLLNMSVINLPLTPAVSGVTFLSGLLLFFAGKSVIVSRKVYWISPYQTLHWHSRMLFLTSLCSIGLFIKVNDRIAGTVQFWYFSLGRKQLPENLLGYYGLCGILLLEWVCVQLGRQCFMPRRDSFKGESVNNLAKSYKISEHPDYSRLYEILELLEPS